MRKFFQLIININVMGLSEETKVTGWEKWINRIVTVALALYNAVQYLLTHWAAK
jgi:hypothetical protein